MASQTSSSFTGLPVEIRLNIYEHSVQTPNRRKNEKAWSATALLCTNRQVFAEAMPILYAHLELDVQSFRIPRYAAAHIRKVYIFLDWELFWANVKKFEVCMWYLIRYCSRLQAMRIRIDAGFVDSPALQKLCLGVSREVVAMCKLEEIVVESVTDPFPWRAMPGTYREGKSDWLRTEMARCLRMATAEAGLRVTVVERLLEFWKTDGDDGASDDESGDEAEGKGIEIEVAAPVSKPWFQVICDGEAVEQSDSEDEVEGRRLRYFEALKSYER